MGKVWLIVVLAAVLAGGAGYWYGQKMGYENAKAEEVQNAAKEANPFDVNPLGNIKTNPFK